MSDNLSDYLTTTQTAVLLGVNRHHINRLLIGGKLKGQKVGNNWMVYRPGIEEYERTKSSAGRPRSGDPQIE